MATDEVSGDSYRLLTGKRLLAFSRRAIAHFLHNGGILLAGGVGYNILLSVIPLFALLWMLLTHVVDDAQLLRLISTQANQLAPAHADVLIDTLRQLLDTPGAIGWLGFLALLFFSSLAFRMLENSIGIIFHHHEAPHERRMWVSLLLPYGFILLIGAALMVAALLISATQALAQLLGSLLDLEATGSRAIGFLVDLLGFAGTFGLFSLIYKIMPVIKISVRRALIGGLVAALLWEVARTGLEYYFLNVSFVSTLYGSMATLVVLLIGLEVGAGILLFGAQVIAELEHNERAGLPWHGQIEE